MGEEGRAREGRGEEGRRGKGGREGEGRSVLSHAASAWRGFTTADDHQRLETVIRRGIRSSFYSEDQCPLSELVEAADDHLFNNILCNKERVLKSVLPSSIQLMY